jgi:hypothetical protein
LLNFCTPVALLAVHPVSYCPTSDLPKAHHHPTQNSVRGTANCMPRNSAPQTECDDAVPDSNWTLGQADARLGGRCGGIVREYARNVKRSVGLVVGQCPIMRAGTYRRSQASEKFGLFLHVGSTHFENTNRSSTIVGPFD